MRSTFKIYFLAYVEALCEWSRKLPDVEITKASHYALKVPFLATEYEIEHNFVCGVPTEAYYNLTSSYKINGS